MRPMCLPVLYVYIYIYIYIYIHTHENISTQIWINIYSIFIYTQVHMPKYIVKLTHKHIYFRIYCHHHIALLARISLTLTWHSSQLSITSGRSFRLQPVSLQSGCRLFLVGEPTLACLHEGNHWRMSLVSSFLLHQQCPTCLVHSISLIFELGGRWPYRCCFVGCCFQNIYMYMFNYLFVYIYIYIYIYIYTRLLA